MDVALLGARRNSHPDASSMPPTCASPRQSDVNDDGAFVVEFREADFLARKITPADVVAKYENDVRSKCGSFLRCHLSFLLFTRRQIRTASASEHNLTAHQQESGVRVAGFPDTPPRASSCEREPMCECRGSRKARVPWDQCQG